ncbi:hypothetical protein ACFLUO_04760 [Chloroflexota bacterium]
MHKETEILAEARRLFDVAGITAYGKDSLLILGLVSTPQRNLDDFYRDEDGVFRLHGFEVHAQPKLDALIQFIQEQGLEARLIGRCGYPLKGELNLKQQAAAAGLGRWGKNSLMLHPEFGPWLRLMAVKVIGAYLSPTGPGESSHEENPICKDCPACIDACPISVLEPYYVRDRDNCLAHVTKSSQTGKLVPCDQCLVVCPAGR